MKSAVTVVLEWNMLSLKCPCNFYVIYKIVLFGKKIIKFDFAYF